MTEQVTPASRAYYDRVLADGIASLVESAADYDSMDIVEANVAMTKHLMSLPLGREHLATAVAGLALRLHRAGGEPRA